MRGAWRLRDRQERISCRRQSRWALIEDRLGRIGMVEDDRERLTRPILATPTTHQVCSQAPTPCINPSPPRRAFSGESRCIWVVIAQIGFIALKRMPESVLAGILMMLLYEVNRLISFLPDDSANVRWWCTSETTAPFSHLAFAFTCIPLSALL